MRTICAGLIGRGSMSCTRIETVGRYPAPGGQFLPPKNAEGVGWSFPGGRMEV